MSIDLDAIRARCEAATKGPWRWRSGREMYLLSDAARRYVVMAFERMGMQGAQPTFRDHQSNLLQPSAKRNLYDFPDAEFIAHARQDIPDLLAEVERLEGTLKGLRLCMNLGCKVIFHADEICPACHKEPK